MDQKWMYGSRMHKRYMVGVSKFLTNAKAHAENENPVFWPCKNCMNQRRLKLSPYKCTITARLV